MSIIPITLAGYFNRFNAADRYEEMLFRPRGLQSAEMNELQGMLLDRLQRIADTIYNDGAVVSGTEPVINSTTGAVVCPPSLIYIEGAIRSVPERSFTIPTTGVVQIGVYLNIEQLTELEVPALRDPAVGTKNFNEPGAARLRVTPTWAHSGEGLQPFFSVYTVNGGVLLNQQPPTANPFLDALRRYDRESNGNYIVSGLEVVAVSPTTFSVREGVGNIFGYKVDRPAAGRLDYPEDPDLEVVVSEPDTYVDGTTPIQLNRTPVQQIQQVVATLQKTVNITRGGTANGTDVLPDVSVVAVTSVTQNAGATVYTSPANWLLSGDAISWSPGGTEPAPGSTYQVTYRYLATVTPANVNLNAGTFTVAGAVAGQLVLTDYSWKLPRFDRICIDRQGALSVVKGTANRFGPIPPLVPDDLLALATVTRNWIGTPPVENDGVKAMPFAELQQVKRLVLDLFELVALERLERDVASREPASKLGVFVDPFFDDDLRDQGITPQSAAVVNGVLQLAIRPVIYRAIDNNSTLQTLPFTEVPVVQQLLRTGSERINPYQTFTPVPVPVTLNPSIDRFTEVVETTVWSDPSWDTFWILGFGVVNNQLAVVPLQTRLQRRFAGTVVNEVDRRPVQLLRQITVAFTILGLDPGETITSLLFDSISLPVGGIPAANGVGTITGSFVIPANVPSGTKLVEFFGSQGNYGAAQFTGDGTLIVTRRTPVFVPAIDPLAQTFRLEQGRVITSVDVWFTAIGNRSNPVKFEIRTTQVGIPDRVIAEGRLDMGPVATGAFTRITLDEPIYLPAQEEFAIVILTDDPTHALALGELGRFDSAAGRWVIAQPYEVGTLLASSNASTWTPFQEKDLTFRLNAAQFTSNTRTVNLGRVRKLTATSVTRSGGTATVTAPGHGFTTGAVVVVSGANQSAYNGAQTITVTGADTFTFPVANSPATPATGTISLLDGDISDLVAMAAVERPTSATDVVFVFTRDDGQQIRGAENARIELTERLTTGITLSAELRGTPTEAPFLFPGTQVMLGNLQAAGVYTSRAFPCQANRRVNVIYDGQIPGASSAQVQVQNSSGTWVTIPTSATSALADGQTEFSHVLASFTAAGTSTRVRLNLAGSPGARPQVRNLRAVVT